MARLFGQTYTREELLQRVGHIDQIAGVREIVLADGRGRGVRAARVSTGGGLAFTVLIDRALDIYDAQIGGTPLGWTSPIGPAHPAYYEPQGAGWLRTFSGGLLVTCGLATMGAPGVDQGEPLPLHGRISNLPAERVHTGGYWDGDEYILFVEGQTRQAVVFGENLLLERRIETRLGATSFSITDTVTNEGFAPQPHMMLYHVNAGFPVVDEGSRLIAPTTRVTPRDADAEAGVGTHGVFSAPVAGYAEQVFVHEMAAAGDGYVTAGLVNPSIGEGFGLAVRYDPSTLPVFNEWKMMGEGLYVVGMEPGTNDVRGRSFARADGTLIELAPGESRSYHVELHAITSENDIAALEAEVEKLVSG
jgi:hypothetical protein